MSTVLRCWKIKGLHGTALVVEETDHPNEVSLCLMQTEANLSRIWLTKEDWHELGQLASPYRYGSDSVKFLPDKEETPEKEVDF